MEQTLVIRRTGEMNREEIRRAQEAANRKALLVKRGRTAVLIGLNVLVALFVLLPLLYAVSVAFMPSSELFTTQMNLLPSSPTLENFRQALIKVPLARFVANSFMVAGLITLGQIISCSLAAFSFSFLDFKGREALFMLVMATMMIPGEATIISNYLTVSRFGWLDSYQVLIVPYLTSAMGIFLFRQFYKSFPISLYESAKIDGCGNLRFFFSIALPLSKAVIAVIALYIAVAQWNSYFNALVYIRSENLKPLQLVVRNILITNQSLVGAGDGLAAQEAMRLANLMKYAVIIITTVPIMCVYPFVQKYFSQGVMIGAIKG